MIATREPAWIAGSRIPFIPATEERLTDNDRLLCEQLEAMAGIGGALHSFVLRAGRRFTPARFSGKRGVPKQCFKNSHRAAIRAAGSLLYCEGFALRPSVGVAIHHAWCCTRDFCVVDSTWNEPECCAYFGVAFEYRDMMLEAMSSGYYSVFDTGHGLNLPFLLRHDPELINRCNSRLNHITERTMHVDLS